MIEDPYGYGSQYMHDIEELQGKLERAEELVERALVSIEEIVSFLESEALCQNSYGQNDEALELKLVGECGCDRWSHEDSEWSRAWYYTQVLDILKRNKS